MYKNIYLPTLKPKARFVLPVNANAKRNFDNTSGQPLAANDSQETHTSQLVRIVRCKFVMAGTYNGTIYRDNYSQSKFLFKKTTGYEPKIVKYGRHRRYNTKFALNQKEYGDMVSMDALIRE